MRNLMLGIALLVTFGVSGLTAQTTTAAATATITIPTMLHIDVTNLAVGFGTPTLTDWDNGYVSSTSAASEITTKANVSHNVTIGTDATVMTTDVGSTTKASSDLEWSTDLSTFVGLSTTAANVLTGLPAGDNTGTTVTYRMLLDAATDSPGSYDLAFTYTVVAQ